MPAAMALVYPLVDLMLARQLELAEGATNRAFIEARALVQPEVGAAWLSRGGAYALFDGVGSPLTQTFGLGLSGSLHTEDLDAIEAFFQERGAAVQHETSPLAPGLLPTLTARGYVPIEYSTVLYRPIEPGMQARTITGITVRRAGVDDADRWAEVAAAGWADEAPALQSFLLGLGRVSARAAGSGAFLAEMDGQPIASAALSVLGPVAVLAGASTLPAARKRGAQRALLDARLCAAADEGCVLAMMAAAPGSASQRNAEREGFRIAYTRVKWALPSAEKAAVSNALS
jgi:GNAT superfamily N-acetyltransferase